MCLLCCNGFPRALYHVQEKCDSLPDKCCNTTEKGDHVQVTCGSVLMGVGMTFCICYFMHKFAREAVGETAWFYTAVGCGIICIFGLFLLCVPCIKSIIRLPGRIYAVRSPCDLDDKSETVTPSELAERGEPKSLPGSSRSSSSRNMDGDFRNQNILPTHTVNSKYHHCIGELRRMHSDSPFVLNGKDITMHHEPLNQKPINSLSEGNLISCTQRDESREAFKTKFLNLNSSSVSVGSGTSADAKLVKSKPYLFHSVKHRALPRIQHATSVDSSAVSSTATNPKFSSDQNICETIV